jgi:hypothetical protein
MMRKLRTVSALAVLLCALSIYAQTANSGYPETQLNPAYALDTGAVNVMVATLPSCPASLQTGAFFKVKPANNNTTTTPTLNVCGLGAKTVVKLNSAALAAGDLVTSAIGEFIYDGTNMQLMNPQTNTSGTVSSIATTGPIGGGTITTTGTITCTTCVTSASSLASGNLMTGAGSQASQTNANIAVSVGGIFTTYDNLTTAGLGVPVMLAVSDVTAQTASQTTVNLIASTGAAGHYIVRIYLDQNALCTTGTGSVYATVNWTDASHAHSAQTVPLNLITSAISTPNGYIDAIIPFWAASATAITYTTTYTACATGTASYDLHANVERTN